MIAGVGHSNYNALAAKLTRRLSNGFSGLVSYTYSKSMDNGSGLRSPGEQLKPQQGDCWECENGRSVFDVRHRLTTSFLYELPVGAGRKYLSQGGVLDVLAGGWQLGGMLRASSGFPLTVTSGVDRSNTAHGYDRPSAVAGVSPDLDNPSTDRLVQRRRVSNAPARDLWQPRPRHAHRAWSVYDRFLGAEELHTLAAITFSFGSKRSTC